MSTQGGSVCKTLDFYGWKSEVEVVKSEASGGKDLLDKNYQ